MVDAASFSSSSQFTPNIGVATLADPPLRSPLHLLFTPALLKCEWYPLAENLQYESTSDRTVFTLIANTSLALECSTQ